MIDPGRLVIGTANFHTYHWDSLGRNLATRDQVAAIIGLAAQMRFAGIDSADGYGFGAAEHALPQHRLLIERLGPMGVTTKVGYNFYNRRYEFGRLVGRHFRHLPADAVVPFDTGRVLSREYLLFAAAQSRRRMAGMHFNLLLHCPDLTDIKRLQCDDTLAYIKDLEYVRQVGVSVKLPEEVFQALKTEGLGIVQIPATTLHSRAMRRAVDAARQRDVAVMVNQPFDGGRKVIDTGGAIRCTNPHLSRTAANNLAGHYVLTELFQMDCFDYAVVGVSSAAQLMGIIRGEPATAHDTHARPPGAGV
ncbi:hypothetical protein H7J86_06385 [Mycobacterium hackensackense]|jgi:aryl-alcohol dehydrogenase-like predicted oxidoreductase|uniref:aldo/keto reductase n=1 Tax=Mycobacterium hackensackense TaxID=228909 RepID=UPI0022659074|nr:aldo/keto reductase [Mycobacterium hackensackense]MCV7251785.1 hypothetical protein [Mycobacterium hackensackense]